MADEQQTREVSSETAPIMESRAGKYLTFCLGAEEYGLVILRVREIIGLMAITKVPRTPHHVRGVINLRGKVIPVLDLRAKFGMETKEDSAETCIIVVESAFQGTPVQIGILVDAVSEVLDIDENDIEDAPVMGSNFNGDFIIGIAKTKDGVKILLEIDRVLAAADVEIARNVNQQSKITADEPEYAEDIQ